MTPEASRERSAPDVVILPEGVFRLADRRELVGYGPMRLFTPCLRIPTVYDLPLDWLRERRILAVITDLDNTLVPWRDYRVASDLAEWFETLHSQGFRTVILTNARPSPTVRKLAQELRTELLLGARKPIGVFFRRALERVSASPSQACVVGDQVFTDVLGGNLAGCYTVLVDRIGEREFIGTRFMRIIERIVLRRLGKAGLLSSDPSASDASCPEPLDRSSASRPRT